MRRCFVRRCLHKSGGRIEPIQAVWYTEMEIDNDYAYQIGEAQRCLYSNGPWMGPKAYFIFLFLFVMITAFLYIGRRNNWYVEKDI